jgi:hypothetical protein
MGALHIRDLLHIVPRTVLLLRDNSRSKRREQLGKHKYTNAKEMYGREEAPINILQELRAGNTTPNETIATQCTPTTTRAWPRKTTTHNL